MGVATFSYLNVSLSRKKLSLLSRSTQGHFEPSHELADFMITGHKYTDVSHGRSQMTQIHGRPLSVKMGICRGLALQKQLSKCAWENAISPLFEYYYLTVPDPMGPSCLTSYCIATICIPDEVAPMSRILRHGWLTEQPVLSHRHRGLILSLRYLFGTLTISGHRHRLDKFQTLSSSLLYLLVGSRWLHRTLLFLTPQRHIP